MITALRAGYSVRIVHFVSLPLQLWKEERTFC